MSAPIFKRRKVEFDTEPPPPAAVRRSNLPLPPPLNDDYRVLVINSSHDMAKEITMELTLRLPGCSMMYAPTLELAKWILRRRQIDLVVSSTILPDGGVMRLKGILESMTSPPDLVVVGEMSKNGISMFENSPYRCTGIRRLNVEPAPAAVPLPEAAPSSTAAPAFRSTIRTLGADIRNDLNNPLQEIVAMVFVAQTTGSAPGAASQALDAIDKAAKNMAALVNSLEEKILHAVTPHTGAGA
jgi:hypothetical protein